MNKLAKIAAFAPMLPWTVELVPWPPDDNRGHHPHREWKKSQKKIRRERRQRMAYKKGGAK